MKDFLFLVPIQRKQICNIDQYLKKSKKKNKKKKKKNKKKKKKKKKKT